MTKARLLYNNSRLNSNGNRALHPLSAVAQKTMRLEYILSFYAYLLAVIIVLDFAVWSDEVP